MVPWIWIHRIYVHMGYHVSMIVQFHESRTMETCNCGTMEPRIYVVMNPHFCSFENQEPWKHGTTELWNNGSTFLWFHESRTMGTCKYGAINQCFCGSMNPGLENHGTTELWNHESMVLCSHKSKFLWFHESRTAEPWIQNYGIMDSWNHRKMYSWDYRTVYSRNHGFGKSLKKIVVPCIVPRPKGQQLAFSHTMLMLVLVHTWPVQCDDYFLGCQYWSLMSISVWMITLPSALGGRCPVQKSKNNFALKSLGRWLSVTWTGNS